MKPNAELRRKRREAGPPLTLEVIDQIEAALAWTGWDKHTLRRNAGTSERTVQSWLDDNARKRAVSSNPMRPRELQHVARALGIALSAPPRSPQARGKPRAPTFNELSSIAEAVDRDLMDVVRRLGTAPARSVRTAYRSVLNESLQRRGFSVERWVSTLEDQVIIDQAIHSLPTPALSISVSPMFESLSFSLSDGRQLPTIYRPELLWDCACESPDARNIVVECPVHRDPLGTATAAAFARKAVTITWRGLTFRWHNSTTLWPPSVDSFAFLLALERAQVFRQRPPSILDLGSGTGFLGIALAVLSGGCARLCLADWLLTPSLYGAVNWALNRRNAKTTLAVRTGLFTDWMPREAVPVSHDIVLCNPPYLPCLRGFDELAVNSVVVGTDLLTHIIEHAQVLGRRVFVAFSSLAAREAVGAAAKYQKQLAPLPKSPRNVPFRVVKAWSDNRAYFDALKQVPNGIWRRTDHRHPYWHAINCCEVVPTHP